MDWLKNAWQNAPWQAARSDADGAGPRPEAPGPSAPALAAAPAGGLELTQLGRYAVVAMLITVCGLLFAWSRIEMVEISADLGRARDQLAAAEAETARLDLELAALTDPTHLSRAATDLGLQADVAVVDVPAEPTAN